MAGKPTQETNESAGKSREQRLKDALKANMAKRKAQSRSRAQGAATQGHPDDKTGQDKGA